MSNPHPAESSGPSVRFIPITFQLIQKQLNKQEFWWDHAEILGLEALAGIWILQDLSKLLLIFWPQNFNMCWTNRLSASGCAPAIKSPHGIPNFTGAALTVGAPLLCCWFLILRNALPSSWWRVNLIPKLLEESMTTPTKWCLWEQKIVQWPQTKPTLHLLSCAGKSRGTNTAPAKWPSSKAALLLQVCPAQPSQAQQSPAAALEPWGCLRCAPAEAPSCSQGTQLVLAHSSLSPHLGWLWSFGLFCDCHSMSLWITKNVWVQLGATGWEATLKIWLQAANRVSVASKWEYRTRVFSGFSIKFILKKTTDLLYYGNKLYLFMALNLHYPKYLIFVTSPLPPLQRKIWNTLMRLFGMTLNYDEFLNQTKNGQTLQGPQGHP